MTRKEESTQVHALQNHPGWKVLKNRWNQRKKEFYEKLRSYRRDREFYQCQGKLDMIDLMFLDVENIINDIFEDDENEGD